MGLKVSLIALSNIPQFFSSMKLTNNENGLQSNNGMFGFMKGCLSKQNDKSLVLRDERVVNLSPKECAKQTNLSSLKETENLLLLSNALQQTSSTKNQNMATNQNSVILGQYQEEKEIQMPSKTFSEIVNESSANYNIQKLQQEYLPLSACCNDASKIDNKGIQQSMEIGNQQSSNLDIMNMGLNLLPIPYQLIQSQQQSSYQQPSRAELIQQKIEENSTRIKDLSQRGQLLSIQYFQSLNSSPIQNPNSNHPQLILAQLTELQQNLIEAIGQNQMLENQLDQIQDHQFLPPDEGLVYDGQSTSTLEDSDVDFEQQI